MTRNFWSKTKLLSYNKLIIRRKKTKSGKIYEYLQYLGYPHGWFNMSYSGELQSKLLVHYLTAKYLTLIEIDSVDYRIMLFKVDNVIYVGDSFKYLYKDKNEGESC